jgi:hypothetical protein
LGGGGGQAFPPTPPPNPVTATPLRGSHHPRRKCGILDLRT